VLRAGIKVYFAADGLELDPRNPDAVYRYAEELAAGFAVLHETGAAIARKAIHLFVRCYGDSCY